MFNKKIGIIYGVLLLLINVIGAFFLGIVFIGSPNVNEEALNHITEKQAAYKQILYGTIISLFFSLLTFFLSILFRHSLSLSKQSLRKILIFQLLFFLIGYLIVYIYIY